MWIWRNQAINTWHHKNNATSFPISYYCVSSSASTQNFTCRRHYLNYVLLWQISRRKLIKGNWTHPRHIYLNTQPLRSNEVSSSELLRSINKVHPSTLTKICDKNSWRFISSLVSGAVYTGTFSDAIVFKPSRFSVRLSPGSVTACLSTYFPLAVQDCIGALVSNIVGFR